MIRSAIRRGVDELLEKGSPDLLFQALNREVVGGNFQSVLCKNDKTILLRGMIDVVPVVAKVCLFEMGEWQERFSSEVKVYEELTKQSLRFNQPRLIAANTADCFLVVEECGGTVIAGHRFLDRCLASDEEKFLFSAISRISAYISPRGGTLSDVCHYYEKRLVGYREIGVSHVCDWQAWERIRPSLQRVCFAHGDLNFSNILLDELGGTILDWEFGQNYLPGYDFATLSVFGLFDESLQAHIRKHVAESAIFLHEFLLNHLLVLLRQLKAHRALPPSAYGSERILALEEALSRTRAELRDVLFQ